MPTRTRSHPLPDARRQNQLAARLRAGPQSRALGVIRRLIARDPKIGLALANRVLRERQALTELLRDGLRQSNESTVRFWIDALGPRLGPTQTIDLIREEASREPAIARRSLYWLPALAKDDAKAKARLDELRRQFSI
jgi:hypothetical protein